MFHSPRIGVQISRAKWYELRVGPRVDKLVATESIAAFVGLLIRHPIVTLYRVVPHMRISRDSGGEEREVRGDLAGPDPDRGPIVSKIGAEDSDDYGIAELRETLAQAEMAYLDRQAVSFAIRHNDAHLFSGPDRDLDGFVRLMLRESYHHFVLPGSDKEHYVVLEPRLLLHESGVIQLDLVLRADGSFDVRQVLAMMWGPQPIIVRSQMSKPLLRRTPWESLADFSSGEEDAAAPLGDLVHATPVSMSDLLEVHLAAVLGVMRERYDGWMVYPVTMLDVDDCCSDGEWRTSHREDLIRLAIRGSVDREIASHVSVPVDLSMGHDHSLHANMGSAVYLQWKGSFPSGIAELDTVLLLEHALLQYMRLAKLEGRVSRLTLNERKLRSRFSESIRLLSELRQRDLRAGEARDIERHVLDALGAPEMRKVVETALELSSSAYAAFSAERASRRAWWITLAATVVALVVAVPSVGEILKSLPPQDDGETWILNPARWLASQGFYGPWIAMGALVALVGIPWIATFAWRHRPGRFASFRRGYRWPTEFTVTADDWGPAVVGGRVTTLEADIGDSGPSHEATHDAEDEKLT
ncbi:hypothetical protein ACI2IX_19805 [Leifsonia aquatica]|uniref:hypothetical protein n=1 Tax=Leifsonia aquatica TaxID=144185 RepID=UPI00384D22B0